MKEIILHIGTPKTGSSFLQKAFVADYEKLLENGIMYPGVEGENFVEYANVDINGQILTRIFRRLKPSEYEQSEVEISRFFKQVLSLPAERILLSDETLGVFPHSIYRHIENVRAELNFKLTVFSYFRKPASYYPSHWSQVVRRHGESRSLIEFCEKEHLPVWQNMIEANRVFSDFYLFSYEDARQGKGVQFSATEVLGLDSNFFSLDAKSEVNPALSLYALTAIRMVNQEYGSEIGCELNELLTKLTPINTGPKAGLTKEVAETLERKHEEEMKQCNSIVNRAMKSN